MIVQGAGKRTLELFRWGLIPWWAKDPAIGNRMINARGETLAEKPAFKDLLGSGQSHQVMAENQAALPGLN